MSGDYPTVYPGEDECSSTVLYSVQYRWLKTLAETLLQDSKQNEINKTWLFYREGSSLASNFNKKLKKASKSMDIVLHFFQSLTIADPQGQWGWGKGRIEPGHVLPKQTKSTLFIGNGGPVHDFY